MTRKTTKAKAEDQQLFMVTSEASTYTCGVLHFNRNGSGRNIDRSYPKSTWR